MSNLAEVKVGDTVMVSMYGRGAKPAVVEKVGRKYVTVDRSRFDMETGSLASGYSGYVQTVQEHEAAAERAALEKTLREQGVELSYRASRISTDALRKILAVVQADASEHSRST